jgi:hypothetical protein
MAVLVATDDGYHIITSSGDRHRALEGHRVEALSPGPNGTWVAVVDHHEIWQHAADGTWTPLASSEQPLASLVTVADVVFAGGAGPQVLRLDGATLRAPGDLDSVPGRDEWHPVGYPMEVRSITATADGALLANIHVGGIIRSDDRGASWQPTIEVDADVHQVLAHPTRPEIAVAAAAVGLCLSNDGGRSWAVVDEGLHATYGTSVAFDGDDVLVGISDGPFARRSALYRHRGGTAAAPPERVGEGLPEWLAGNVDTRCLAVDSGRIALGDGDGDVWVNTGAAGWNRVARGLGDITAIAVV